MTQHGCASCGRLRYFRWRRWRNTGGGWGKGGRGTSAEQKNPRDQDRRDISRASPAPALQPQPPMAVPVWRNPAVVSRWQDREAQGQRVKSIALSRKPPLVSNAGRAYAGTFETMPSATNGFPPTE